MIFKNLFSPIAVGTLQLKNRIVQTPHNTRFESNGRPNERLANYYAERAKGGVGLIITGAQSVHPTSFRESAETHNDTDEVIPSLRMIAEAVHQHGGRIFGQINHRGRQMGSVFSKRSIVAPSPIPCGFVRETPKELNIKEIEEIIQAYANAARRLKVAGFDGVELHAAHGYLVAQFLSPYSNKRQDEYGGSLENRMRFCVQIVDLVRKTIGREFPFGIRLVGDEFLDGGLTLDDTKEIARRIDGKGTIDYISVSQGTYETGFVITAPSYIPLGSFMYIASGIKENVQVPVICSGRINDPVQAEKILEDGQADLIGMTRALIADPEWPKKAMEGRLDDIRKCIACNQGCREKPVACTVNPEVGREKEMALISKAKVRKRVMVVGGGPAGLEVARVAATRGHRVTLYEKKESLGGQIRLIANDPKRNEFGDSVRFLQRQIENLGVEVRLSAEVNANLIKQADPDVVVIATGSRPYKPPVEGINQSNVVTSHDVLESSVEIGERVVIVGGKDGHYPPLTIADFLAGQGKNVDLLSELSLPGQDIDAGTVFLLYKSLFEKGVNIHSFTGLKKISGGVVTVYNTLTKKEREIENVNNIVIVIGNQANNDLVKSLEGYTKEFYAIGDCVSPRKVPEIIFEASRLGRTL